MEDTGPNREQKHMSIFHAVRRLGDTAESLQNLIGAVGGSGTPERSEKSAEVTSNPSLLSTLDHAGDEIVGLSSRINDMINELRELIL